MSRVRLTINLGRNRIETVATTTEDPAELDDPDRAPALLER